MAKKKKGGKGYLNSGFGWLVNLILAIIPVTSIVLGIVTRVQRGHLLGAILNFVLCPLFYVIDIITVILQGNITVLA